MSPTSYQAAPPRVIDTTRVAALLQLPSRPRRDCPSATTSAGQLAQSPAKQSLSGAGAVTHPMRSPSLPPDVTSRLRLWFGGVRTKRLSVDIDGFPGVLDPLKCRTGHCVRAILGDYEVRTFDPLQKFQRSKLSLLAN